MRHVLALTSLLVLAACGGKAHEETQTTVTKNGVTTTTITRRDVGHVERDGDANTTVSGLKIDSDKFKADVEIPGLSFGGEHMDLAGMKLYPGSTVKGVHVHAVDRPGQTSGEVVVDFTSPAAPLVVAQHMAGQARQAGFALASNTSAIVSGSKPGAKDRFSVTLNPNGTATRGQLTITDTKS